MVDAYDTWWNDGKPYLCRIIDMLHMGYVDEVLFGREAITNLPAIVHEWVRIAKQRMKTPDAPVITPTNINK
jgi:predicted RNase H-like nuclease